MFIFSLGLGYLHGVQPQVVAESIQGAPEKIQILCTDEIFFPDFVRSYLEKELNVTLSITLTRNWEAIQAKSIENSGVDLILLPSFWAESLAHQGFLSSFNLSTDENIFASISSDFIKSKTQGQTYFLPLYWIKTGIQVSKNLSFQQFLNDKQLTTLFLLADEDLLLRHFQLWKEQGLWPLVAQKKILTLQLDQLDSKETRGGAFERRLDPDFRGEDQGNLSALLIWGAAIPEGSSKKDLVRRLLAALVQPRLQSEVIKKSPLNSVLVDLEDERIPLHRRASFVRELRLKDSLLLDQKNSDAKEDLKRDFNFIL